MSVLIKGITLEQFYRDLNNVRDMDPDWDIAQLSDDVVERKRGEWIDPADLICYKCTACGNYANQGYGLDEPIFWDYCPNCGADMRKQK